jgi:hypothetical protein
LAAAALLACLASAALPDDRKEPPGRDTGEARETSRLIQEELPRWEVARGIDAAKLKLDSKPILRWTNPASGRMYGEIYVWTADGRPEAIMSLYKVWEPAWGFAGELQSLSPAKLAAERDETVFWKCDEPGMTLRDVPDAPATAETPARRMQQMRAMADDFSAVLMDTRRASKIERQALRMLTKPVYRYSSPDGRVVDGALFAFVLGTDPEVFLLLEARGSKDASRWQYALARLNSDELAASFKEEEVWRVGRAKFNERHEPYSFFSLPEALPGK